jgi:hypothetical protein
MTETATVIPPALFNQSKIFWNMDFSISSSLPRA